MGRRDNDVDKRQTVCFCPETRGRRFIWFIPQNTCCHLLLHFVTPLQVFVLLCVAVHIL